MISRIEELLRNNRAFVEQQLQLDTGYFEKLAEGQHPEFLWVGCSDSRVPGVMICIGILRSFWQRSLLGLMNDDALQHVDVTLPRLFRENAPPVLVSRLPAGADARAGEVDVLGVVLSV